MGFTDKVKNKAQVLRGKAEETAGKATGNDDLEVDGTSDKAKCNIKQAGEKVKDALGVNEK